MEGSTIARALRLKFEPVAILWSDTKPDGAIQFAKGRWGCVMWLFAQAARGRTAAADRETFGCFGGGTGLGFGNQFEHSPGGMEGFSHFLSTGIEQCRNPRAFRPLLDRFAREEQKEQFLKGERLFKSPDLVKSFARHLPVTEIPARYVVFTPVKNASGEKPPVAVVFVGDPVQISGLVTLANYDRPDAPAVVVPPGAGCHQILIHAYKEAASLEPRAVLGLTDIAARKNLVNLLGNDVFTFTVPWQMYLRMEANVPGSFLGRPVWKSLIERYPEKLNADSRTD
jgi:uncharacterized protein (DUF169 family)